MNRKECKKCSSVCSLRDKELGSSIYRSTGRTVEQSMPGFDTSHCNKALDGASRVA